MAEPTQIEAAVRRHNLSLTHRVWRFAREGPTAAVILVTCPVTTAVRPPLPGSHYD
jgi:hypothetical protein